MQFVEDADGVPVDGDRAGTMRQQAQAIWDHFATKAIPIKTWTKMTRLTSNITTLTCADNSLNCIYLT